MLVGVYSTVTNVVKAIIDHIAFTPECYHLEGIMFFFHDNQLHKKSRVSKICYYILPTSYTSLHCLYIARSTSCWPFQECVSGL